MVKGNEPKATISALRRSLTHWGLTVSVSSAPGLTGAWAAKETGRIREKITVRTLETSTFSIDILL
jgi:hypothetical protein